MPQPAGLTRFLDAQERSYATAFAEVAAGRKRTHWMWYIFPQVRGLGLSATSQQYAISNLAEAKAYLSHPVLGPRLMNICGALLHTGKCNATAIFGSPDDMKLRSSMTLFASVPGSDPLFRQILDKFFGGAADARTLDILRDHAAPF